MNGWLYLLNRIGLSRLLLFAIIILVELGHWQLNIGVNVNSGRLNALLGKRNASEDSLHVVVSEGLLSYIRGILP